MDAVIDAVLFDLDETLTDRSASMSRYAAVFHRDFARHLRSVSVAEVESTFVALDERGYRPRDEVFAGIVTSLPWESEPDVRMVGDHWRTSFPASTVGRVGLEETLIGLTARGIRLGIVTNGLVMTQAAKIEHLGIRTHFSSVVISEAANCSKPDSRIFRRALDEIGCHAAGAWFVGDHPVNDVLGSAAAGLVPVWLEGIHPWPTAHAGPERRIRALRELLGLVSRAASREDRRCDA